MSDTLQVLLEKAASLKTAYLGAREALSKYLINNIGIMCSEFERLHNEIADLKEALEDGRNEYKEAMERMDS